MHQGLDIRDMRQGQNLIPIELLIMGHISRQYRQPHIHPSKKGLNLYDLSDLTRGCCELVKCAGLRFIQRDPERHFHSISQRGPIDDGLLPFDHACFLHLLYATPTQACANAAAFGQFRGGQAGIRLKVAQDSPIYVIKHDFLHFS